MEKNIENIIDQWMKEVKDEDQMTEKQRNILEASIKLFSEKGFHASSTSEIAKEAGVAEGTIFRHFKNKKDILLTVTAPLFIKFLSPYILKDAKKIMDNTELPVDVVLKTIYKNRLELVEKNWDRIRIIFQEATFHPELRESIFNNIAKQARQIVGVFVENRIEKGELRPLPTPTVTRAIFSMMFGYIVFKHLLFPNEEIIDSNDEEEIDIMVDILMNGIKNRY